MNLIGPSYNLESRPASVQRTINMVPVPLEPGNERSPWVFKDVPGLVLAVPAADPPVAGFYGLRSSATAAYEKTVGFDANGIGTIPLAPSEYPLADEVLSLFFQPYAGNLTPQTWESYSPGSLGGLSLTYTDAPAASDVTITAASGSIAEATAGTTDGQGRYSVAWTDGVGYFPADGGSKFLRVVTNGATVTFQFSKRIASFGVYLVDYLDFGGTCTWTFHNGGTLLHSEVVDPFPLTAGSVATNGSVGFAGFISKTTAAPFDRVVFTFSSTGADLTAFDNIFVGSLDQMSALAVSTGQTIQFTDTSTNSPTSWLWDFGDGTTSTLQNPTKSYSTAGLKTVTLTATNSGGSDAITKADYIVVS